MYGIKSSMDACAGEDDNGDDDLEVSIQKEVAALRSQQKMSDGGGVGEQGLFTPMRMNVDCVVFVKTRAPVAPVDFVRRICADAKANVEPGQLKCRYVNRLTPVAVIGKASESGLVEVAKEALTPFFDLAGKDSGDRQHGSAARTRPEGSTVSCGGGELTAWLMF